ncbi:unnamed protein product [Penicillium olsonii]|nr:unnamed protein product [Penicillium olsonii]CAG7922874.1 unnamed protein product [Penicillium olsonii]
MHHSQLAPLPNDVPFRIVSRTIGQGAYACIKKACPLDDDNPVFAVKYIHKDYAARHGKISARQLAMEVTVHKHVSGHGNIIEFFTTGEDEVWRWIAMELAEGGDLFDKIEADEGVGEDIAHVYFSQLVSAVGFMHSKGVGHRDIKPENMLLTGDGNLKIADFGLAVLFEYKGARKLSTTFCGSPPYIAPEVITSNRGATKGTTKGAGYHADLVDIWSCGIVLFVLLAGNTPWDSPTDDSYEYHEYVATNSRTTDELWQKLPSATLSLLRGMLTVDPRSRFSLEDVRRHPWYTRSNKFLSIDGKLRDPINLATSMFESLHIDFTQNPLSRTRKDTGRSFDPMDMDMEDNTSGFSSTQPEMLGGGVMVDWDNPQESDVFSSTQPLGKQFASQDAVIAGHLEDEPSMSQFSQQPAVPLSRTQNAQKFQDIIPSRAMTRFYSLWELKLLVPLICEALHRLGVPVPSVPAVSAGDTSAHIRVSAKDGRMCILQGKVLIECVSEGVFEVEFVKVKGDPLEWRRFFKKVAILCKDAVFRPDE